MMAVAVFLTVAGAMLASGGRRIGIFFAGAGIAAAGALALQGGAL